MNFFLGTHQPGWLARTRVPLFVSYKRLKSYKALPKATSRWALDSGAFSELADYGRWTLAPRKYAEAVQRLQETIGNLQWASIQDWICSPAVLARTRLAIKSHQMRTIESFHTLQRWAPEVRWIPILQGWDVESYIAHLEMYKVSGIELDREELVGVGSLASRQQSDDVPQVLSRLQANRLRIHGFGLSLAGLKRVSGSLVSADSMVWSFIARRRRLKYDRCRSKHSVCNNCLAYALSWRRQIQIQCK